MNKEIIIEINRGLEIMGLPQKKVINEQWFKFLRGIEDLLTNVSQDAGSTFVKVGDVNVPQNIYQKLRNLLSDPGNYDALDREAKIFFNRILTSNKQLFDRIYDDAIDSFLADNPGLTKPEFLKKLAKDVEDLRVDNPLASVEDVLKNSGIDEGTAKALDTRLMDEVSPYMTWKIDGRVIEPRLISGWTKFWDEWNPIIFKNIQYKWLSGYLRGVENAREKIFKQLEIIKEKLQKTKGGESAAENIQDNLENIWFLIAGMRKSGLETGYAETVKKYISENKLLPADQVEMFMKQPFVKSAMDASLNRANKEAGIMTARFVQNLMSTLPIFNFVQSAWRKGGIGKLGIQDWLGLIFPNVKRLAYYTLYKSPFSPDEIAEMSMRTGRNASVVEAIVGWVVWENVIKPSLISLMRVAIENWFIIPEFKEKLALIRELCPYGIIKDEQGNPMDCETLEQELKYKHWEQFVEYWKENLPTSEWFTEWWEDITDNEGVWWNAYDASFGTVWKTILALTQSDEFLANTKKYVLEPGIFRTGTPLWKEWETQISEQYDESMKDVYKVLEEDGFPVHNKAEFLEFARKKLEDMKKKYPEIEKGKGDYKNKLEDFKDWLIKVNGLQNREVVNATMNVEKINGKDKNIYLIDSTKPVDEITNPKYVWFPNGTFYRLGQTPIQEKIKEKKSILIEQPIRNKPSEGFSHVKLPINEQSGFAPIVKYQKMGCQVVLHRDGVRYKECPNRI